VCDLMQMQTTCLRVTCCRPSVHLYGIVTAPTRLHCVALLGFGRYIQRVTGERSTPPHLIQGIRAGVGACEAMLVRGHTPSLTMPYIATTFEDDGTVLFPTANFGVTKRSGGRRIENDLCGILDLVADWKAGTGFDRVVAYPRAAVDPPAHRLVQPHTHLHPASHPPAPSFA
jgi:hypothetical protein